MMFETLLDRRSVWLINGNSLHEIPRLDAASVDAVVCDPPYELGFMGKAWDASGIAFNVQLWREVLRVLKPGGHLLAFSGTRTYHRMTVAIEDAGFEIRDCLSWQYGSGFPKSLNVAIAIDKAAGAMGHRGKAAGVAGSTPGRELEIAKHVAEHEGITDDARRWQGWGTALKPAWEPIVVARKPLEGTVAANVLKHGTGAINVDGCRVQTRPRTTHAHGNVKYDYADHHVYTGVWRGHTSEGADGRWPANVLLSCPPDCDGDTHAGGCPCAALDAQSGQSKTPNKVTRGVTKANRLFKICSKQTTVECYGDTGGASRFFNRLPIEAEDMPPFIYAAKASRREREDGCDALPARTGSEAVDREEGTAGTQSPRAGAGCTASTVRNHHPTVKPVAVMRHLVRLVTPPGGTVLDPFMGSGSTGIAAVREGFAFIGIEMSEEYLAIARARIENAR
jgi:DNA modification methylase